MRQENIPPTDTIMSMLDSAEPIPLSPRFAKLKRNMIACREKDVAESFYRLLRTLRAEVSEIAARGSDVIPTIDYIDIDDREKASAFKEALKKRGVAIIKRVVPATVTETWKDETMDYIADNPQTRGQPSHDPRLLNLYWSPSQVRARADSRLLDAQRFAMGTWHSSDEEALVSGDYPVVYADRLRIRTPDDAIRAGSAHVDNGSAERWEPDGYGASGTYNSVFSGHWEEYDPWDSAPRLHITTDLYNRFGSCSMFRMFQGFLSLSAIPAGTGSLTVCPMLQSSTAYLLLRPFFTPRHQDPAARMSDSSMGAEMDYLHPNNWNLNVSQTSILHGAIPGNVQTLNNTLHPHLQLDKTLVSLPDIEPGDYVIWHPDTVHAINTSCLDQSTNFSPSTSFNPNDYTYFSRPPSPTHSTSSSLSHSSNPGSTTGAGVISAISRNSSFSSPLTLRPSPISRSPYLHATPSTSMPTTAATTKASPHFLPPHRKHTTAVLYIPACPLTQTNALYLSRQRRAFLLGLPAPDFSESGRGSTGERDYAGRSTAQDVADAGGAEGLRSMGLTPWEGPRWHGGGYDSDDERGLRAREKDGRLLQLANGILFPDRYDGVLNPGGRR